MVPTTKLVYDFIRKNNVNDSGQNVDYPLQSIIAYINEAYQIWYRTKISIAQGDQKARNDLRYFKKDMISLSLVKDGTLKYLAKYPDDFYYRLNQIAIASKKECCPDSKRIIPRIIESDDLYEALSNPYRKPDFFYEQLLAIESSEGLSVYVDGEMDIDELYIDYYIKPGELHAPSHEKCGPEMYYMYDGRAIFKDVSFLGDEHSANDIVDIALLCASTDNRDFQSFQLRVNSILGITSLKK